MLEAHCICGAVRVTVEMQPDFVHDCNCSLCRKSGAVWGYYASTSVTIKGPTEGIVRQDKENPVVEVHSCRTCAATTHWTVTDRYKEQYDVPDRMGVNMRLFDAPALNGVELRFPDGNSWTGEGEFGYRRDAFIISDETPL